MPAMYIRVLCVKTLLRYAWKLCVAGCYALLYFDCVYFYFKFLFFLVSFAALRTHFLVNTISRTN